MIQDKNQVWAHLNGNMYGYCWFAYDDYWALTVYDHGFELENILIHKDGSLKCHDRYVNPKLYASPEDFIERYPEAYTYILEKEKEQRWSSLIDIIGLDLPNWLPRDVAFTGTWILERSRLIEENRLDMDMEFEPYFRLQEQLKEKVVRHNELPETIRFIAGVDVAYNDADNKMVGAIVVLDASTLEVVESSHHVMETTFPYVPGLFSFREIPPLLEAFKKLSVKPDLIVCDGQGIAHPKGVGMATHLGIELDIPTIGCAKKRLIGVYDKESLPTERGSQQELIWNDETVGVALRTQDGINPMFVSIGHKIDLETSINWVLKLCNQYRLPETTRQSDHLVNQLLKEITDINLMGDPD